MSAGQQSHQRWFAVFVGTALGAAGGRIPPRILRHVMNYGVAVLSIILGTIVRMLLDPILGEEFPFVPFICAIVFTAWYGGLGPSICAMILGFLSTAYFFLTPRESVLIGALHSQIGAVLYIIVGATTIWFSEVMHAAQRRANANEEELLRKQSALELEIRERRDAQAAYVTLLRKVVEIQEDERRRISRELHDQCGQDLTALDLGLKLIERKVSDDAAAMRQVKGMHETLSRVAREVHDLALELRPPSLDDLGLSAAIKGFLESWSSRTNIAVDFESRGLKDQAIPIEIETAIYRVVMESLTNVAKHARASRVSVVLEGQPHFLLAIIEDQGAGFHMHSPSPASVPHQHLGLLGMRERLQAVGGELEIESVVGAGTTIFARVPLTGACRNDCS